MPNTLKQRVLPPVRRALITTALEALRVVQLTGLGAGSRGHGAIFMLHLVRPEDKRAFRPNAHLEITPEFLDLAIRQLTSDGFEFVAIDEVPERLARTPGDRPFAAFTLDDGYANNLHHAAPVFARHAVPFTVYVTAGFVEATHTMWWETLAELLHRVETLEIDLGSGPVVLAARGVAEKLAAFDRIAEMITGGGDERLAIARLDAAAMQNGVDPLALTRQLTMRPDELTELTRLPLASLGAHTISHRNLCLLSDEELDRELAVSAALVRDLTGRPATSFAYPYGNARTVSAREARAVERHGFSLAVTTRSATLTPDRNRRLSLLPRISLNGYYQKARYASVLASGLPFVLSRPRGGDF